MTFLTKRNPARYDYFPSVLEDSFLERFFGEDAALSSFSPRVDISEDKEAYHLEAELPGVRQEDIKLNYEKGILTLSGCKGHSEEKKEKNFLRRETYVGNFSRSFRLSEDVDQDKIIARFDKGVLSVLLPKGQNAQVRTIPINS